MAFFILPKNHLYYKVAIPNSGSWTMLEPPLNTSRMVNREKLNKNYKLVKNYKETNNLLSDYRNSLNKKILLDLSE